MNYVNPAFKPLFFYNQIKSCKIQNSLVGSYHIIPQRKGSLINHEATLNNKVNSILNSFRETGPELLNNFDPVFLINPEEKKLPILATSENNNKEIFVLAENSNGIRHEIAPLNLNTQKELQNWVSNNPVIADGHHRLAAASLFANEINKVVSLPAMLVSSSDVSLKSFNLFIPSNNIGFMIIEKLIEKFVPANLHECDFAIFYNENWQGYKAIHTWSAVKILHQIRNTIELFLSNEKIQYIPGYLGKDGIEQVAKNTSGVGLIMPVLSIQDVINSALKSEYFPPHTTWFDEKPINGFSTLIKQLAPQFESIQGSTY